MKYDIDQIKAFKGLYEKLKEIENIKAGQVVKALNLSFVGYNIPMIKSKQDFMEVLEILED